MGQREWAAAPGLTQNGDGRWEWGPDPNWDLWGGLWGPMGTAGGGAGERRWAQAGNVGRKGGPGGGGGCGAAAGGFWGGSGAPSPGKGVPVGPYLSAVWGCSRHHDAGDNGDDGGGDSSDPGQRSAAASAMLSARARARHGTKSEHAEPCWRGAPDTGVLLGHPPPPQPGPGVSFCRPPTPRVPLRRPSLHPSLALRVPLCPHPPPPHRQGSPRVTPPPPPGVPLSPPTPSLALRVPHVMAPHL